MVDGNGSERGASLVGYVLMAAAVALVASFGVQLIGDGTDQELEYTAAAIDNQNLLAKPGAGASGGSGASGGATTGGSGGGSTVGFGSTETDPGHDGAAEASTSFEDELPGWNPYREGEKIGIWTVAQGSVDPFPTGAEEPDGFKILDLNGHPPGNTVGAIETELRVARGADYTMTVQIGENHHCGSRTADGVYRTGQVTWNGEVVGTFSVDTDYGEFETHTFDLPPNGTDYGTLRIESTMGGTCGPAIDLPAVNLALR